MLYLAGQVGQDTELDVIEDRKTQFIQVLENVKTVLTVAVQL